MHKGGGGGGSGGGGGGGRSMTELNHLIYAAAMAVYRRNKWNSKL
jgi:hypothetical protein